MKKTALAAYRLPGSFSFPSSFYVYAADSVIIIIVVIIVVAVSIA